MLSFTINDSATQKPAPLELLYAECKKCNTPLLWKKEQSIQVLKALEISENTLNFFSMFISAGCPHCTPNEAQYAIEVIDTRKTSYSVNTNSKLFWSNKL